MSAAATTSTRSRLLQTPAIAVAIGTLGVASGRAPAGVVGPLIECRCSWPRLRRSVGAAPSLPSLIAGRSRR